MKKRILVVDDDQDILKVLKANLEIHNFHVTTAEDLGHTEQILEKEEFDLIILDLMLPDGDGIEMCGRLREGGVNTPVIILTAKDKVSDKVLGLECGADDYVVKPFETLELLARIRACLRRTSEQNSDNISCGDIDIDKRKRIVKVRDKQVDLTPKEYDLLLYFIANKGEVIEREKIRKSVWKNSSLYSWSRVIDVHIQHIRQKIEKDATNPQYIVTVPGVGYMFDAGS